MSVAQIKRNRRWRWWPLLLVLVLAGAAVAVFLLRRPVNGQAQTASTVETAVANQETFRVSVTGPGTLAARQTLDVKSQVQGTILTLPSVGERVTRGQLIVQLDPASYQRAVDSARLALEKAKAQLESTRASQSSAIASQQQSIASAEAAYANAQVQVQSARANLEATQRVFAAGGATQQALNEAQRALDQAQINLESARVALQTARQSLPLRQSSNTQDLRNLQLAVDQAQLNLKNAQQDLAYTKIYAPFSGTVSAVSAQVGGVGVGASVGASTALMTLIDDSSVDLPVQVDQTEIGKVKLGQKALVTLDAFEGETFEGKVTAISPSATVVQNIAVFYVTVNVPNPERKLRPGMSAEGEIIAQEIPDAVLVPLRAVERVRTRAYVRVVKEEGAEPELRLVRLGPDDGSQVVVTSGLQPGETVQLIPRQPRSTNTQQRQGGGFGVPIRIPAGGGR